MANAINKKDTLKSDPQAIDNHSKFGDISFIPHQENTSNTPAQSATNGARTVKTKPAPVN
jgi:hypothetical protein